MTYRKFRIAMAVVVGAALLAPAAFAQVKDHTKIKFPKLPKFEIPEPEVHELDNGIKIFLMEDRELPLIRVSAVMRGGSFSVR